MRDIARKAEYMKEYHRTYMARCREDPACIERIRDNAARHRNRPGGREAKRAARYERVYGITQAAVDAMHEQQEGRCAICGGYPEDGDVLRVDHNHETDEVRGLLCHKCNAGIGLLQDNPDIIRRALEYLS